MIDLHCHTLHSDGTDTSEGLALLGDEARLSALCLTDHDTLAGIPGFLAMQPRVKVRLLVGTELSCRFLNQSLHVLGLLVDPANARFQARLVELRGRRDDRNRRMILRLAELGCPVTYEDVQAQADSPLLSRVHFAKALAARGFVRRPQEAFTRLIGDDCPGFVPREELSPAEASLWIREAGGVPVVAHPGRFAGGGFRWEQAMAELQREGLEGLEGYYGEYRAAEQKYFVTLAAKLGMVVTGGSDYHGGNKPGLRLGRGRGGLQVPDDLLDRLETQQRIGSYR
ncbi:PHP domain-containing protein [Geothrix sp. PMB-07]|uniref:PHP domain-containing protein n=1 Tax=Geothrix sp. PMB-07 TaxID=3068640 RepID=UPI00274094CB|nr:PHP domain-containing protein [Geothrix sp. PMB-07]WLT33521.1 PHP domain-containing protein [Geothrix sp. PMB-07]